MARAYTAWVLQKGKDAETPEFIRIAGSAVLTTKRVKEATQFGRRADAANVAGITAPTSAGFAPREKTFG